jgi:hypothetical protein
MGGKRRRLHALHRVLIGAKSVKFLHPIASDIDNRNAWAGYGYSPSKTNRSLTTSRFDLSELFKDCAPTAPTSSASPPNTPPQSPPYSPRGHRRDRSNSFSSSPSSSSDEGDDHSEGQADGMMGDSMDSDIFRGFVPSMRPPKKRHQVDLQPQNLLPDEEGEAARAQEQEEEAAAARERELEELRQRGAERREIEEARVRQRGDERAERLAREIEEARDVPIARFDPMRDPGSITRDVYDDDLGLGAAAGRSTEWVDGCVSILMSGNNRPHLTHVFRSMFLNDYRGGQLQAACWDSFC